MAGTVVIAFLLLAAGPAPAALPEIDFEAVPPGVADAVAGAQLTPDQQLLKHEASSAADTLLNSQSLVAELQVAAQLAGLDPLAPSRPAPAPVTIPNRPELEAPVGQLLGAIQAAEGYAAAAVPDPDAAASLLGELDDLLADAVATVDSEAQSAAVDLGPRHALQSTIDDFQSRLAGTISQQLLYEGALIVAQAIEEVTPALTAISGTHPAPDGVVDGCDVFDEPGVVCVGGEGSNVFTEDYPLVIALGGNNVHQHSAGGACLAALDPHVVHCQDSPGHDSPVAVTIDVAGNDLYAPTEVSPGQPVLGAGIGAIGILVDLEGDDVYDLETDSAIAWSHGAGMAGVGIFVDEQGDDAYRVGDEGGAGFGYGFGGLGLFMDRGGADETTLTDNRTSEEDIRGGVQAFGVGSAGVGLHVHQGDGDNEIVAQIHSDPGFSEPGAQFPLPLVWAFGSGLLGGVGFTVSGAGDDLRRVEIVDDYAQAAGIFNGRGVIRVWSHGKAFVDGLGVVYSTGGDNRYVIDIETNASHEVVVDGACDDCPPARTHVSTNHIQAYGMAMAWWQSAAFLIDLAGNDEYVIDVRRHATAHAQDDRTDGAARADARTTPGNVHLRGQAWVDTFLDAFSQLHDADGDDRYVLSLHQDIRATATNRDDSVQPRALASCADVVWPAWHIGISGQAFTYGPTESATGRTILLDESGADTFIASHTCADHVIPADDTVEPVELAPPSVQATSVTMPGGRPALLLAGPGGDNRFVQEPELPAPCVGERGGRYWIPCWSDTIVPSSAIGVNLGS